MFVIAHNKLTLISDNSIPKSPSSLPRKKAKGIKIIASIEVIIVINRILPVPYMKFEKHVLYIIINIYIAIQADSELSIFNSLPIHFI